MSTYQNYTSTAAALIAFAAGQCRRHVEIDGHVIDLVQAMAEQGRVREDPTGDAVSTARMADVDPATWDWAVARNVAAAMRSSAPVEVPEEVYQRQVLGIEVPASRPKPGPLCPCCLRPEALTGGEP